MSRRSSERSWATRSPTSSSSILPSDGVRTMTQATTGLIEAYREAGQEQVFAFVDQLDAGGRARLLAEAAEIDLGEVDRLVRTLVAGGASPAVDLEGLEPAPYERLPSGGGSASEWARGEGGGGGGAPGGASRGVHGGRGPGHAPRVRRPQGDVSRDAGHGTIPSSRSSPRRSSPRAGATAGRSTGSS